MRFGSLGSLVIGGVLVGAAALAADEGYHQPPADILAILDAQPAVTADVSPDRKWVVSTQQDKKVKTIAELADPVIYLAGNQVRPNVDTRIEDLGITRLTLKSVDGKIERIIEPPAGGRIGEVVWVKDPASKGQLAYLTMHQGTMALHLYDPTSGTDRVVQTPGTAGKLANLSFTLDGRYLAYTIAPNKNALVLAIADTRSGTAKVIEGMTPSHTLPGWGGSAIGWTKGRPPLLVQAVPAGRGAPPQASAVPTGPIVQESYGVDQPTRTYQNLLKSPDDEALFDYYFTTQITAVDVDGRATPIGKPDINADISISPDSKYLLVGVVHRPYSYTLNLGNFPKKTSIWTMDGREVLTVLDTELRGEPMGRDAVLDGKRGIAWRPDAPATLTWLEALDGGDPNKVVAKRDRQFMLAAPFTGKPVVVAETEWRMGGVNWLLPKLALVLEKSSKLARTRFWAIDPQNLSAKPRLLWDRSSEDMYTDPGNFVTVQHPTEDRTIPLRSSDGRSLYLIGDGAAPGGARPFLDSFDIATGKTQRVWQSSGQWYEKAVSVLDADAKRLLISRESPTQWPNMYALTRSSGQLTQLTDLPEPSPWFAKVKGELIQYKRKDGVDLKATLYLPPGYDKARDGRLPFFFWAYPREFLTAAGASQNKDSPYQFKRPEVGPYNQYLILLAHGYGVLDGPTFPIVSQNGSEPNDNYVSQLVSGAAAAVDAVVQMGVADPKRIGIGGHSYGSFMTANLLAHSDLFRAGIAQSGAFNRTLTPFGFQAEPRMYWQARDVYLSMSPFNFANQIKEPILIIHGMRDSNPGTFPVQSERMFAAIKGNGGNVRYVQLPLEDHGYSSRESQRHVIWEWLNWLDKYVKNADRSVSAGR